MKVNYETGFQIGVMEARLKKMRKQRDEYKKQRDELIGDIAKLRERNEELENMWRTLKNELFGRYEFYRFRLSELQIESRANKEVAIYYRRAEINLSVILCRMDKLDGTNEFYEFLGQMEDDTNE
ncbi:TPA: acetyltransferase [Staphylococcus aureus]|nr:acetyltransferase [Staphylococcus aureus]